MHRYVHTYILIEKKGLKFLMLVVDFGKLRNVVCYCHVLLFSVYFVHIFCVFLSSTKGI